MPEAQRTLKDAFTLTGTGLHEGKPATIRVLPAAPDSGFMFIRTDLPYRPQLPFVPEFVGQKQRRTQLTRGRAEVHTCEHLIAGLFGIGVDNAIIEIDGPEPPAGDGSAKIFADAALAVGLVEQDAKRRTHQITEEQKIELKGSTIVLKPADAETKGQTHYEYTLDYGVPELPRSNISYTWSAESFSQDYAPARTFCLESEAQALKAAGFGKGANTQNTLVVGQSGVIENELRFADEFARHKVLDLIGDLALAGCRIEGKIIATKSGHALNQMVAAEVAKALKEKDREKPRDYPIRSGVWDYMTRAEMQEWLPHRFPFLMVDRVTHIDYDNLLMRGYKNLTFNEHFFEGHFPTEPVMPGVLQIEAMAQLGGLLAGSSGEYNRSVGFLTNIDDVRFRRPAVPGDRLEMEVSIISQRRGFVEMKGVATVDGELSCSAKIRFFMKENAR